MLKQLLFTTRLLNAKTLGIVAAVALFAAPSASNAQTPEKMLAQGPSQEDVDVDYPSREETGKCTTKQFKEPGYTCVGLYKPDGTTLLRVWAAPARRSNEEKQGGVEQIRFYKNGVEVFRDVLGKEARWLNTGGTRRGAVAPNNRKQIVEWTVISPQETSQEVVAALKTRDFERFQRVALTADEAQALGLTGSIAAEVQNQIKGVTQAAFDKLAQTLNIPEDANWGALNAGRPATIPAGEKTSSDLDVYYNAAVVVMRGEAENAQSQEIFISDIVKVGSAWKVVGLPVGEPFGQGTGAASAQSIFLPSGGDANVGGATSDVGEMGAALSEAYAKLGEATAQTYPELCEQTVQLLVNIAESNPQERDNMLMQAIDAVFSGVQSGLYPGGAKKLAEMGETFANASQEVKARLRQRQITADFYAVSQAQPQPSARELTKAQDKYTDDLAAFVEEYGATTAGEEAAMTLALDQEYMLENEAAMKYYQQTAQNAGQTPIGQKARGALARLQSEGGALKAPQMQYFGGGAVDFNALKGKPTIIFFWGSWDVDSVNAVKAVANQANVVGVNVDTPPDASAANAYYQQILKGIPWKNVCDPAGLDGAPAIAFGVQTAPWVILLDKQGNVVRSNIANLEELPDVIKEMK